MNNNASILVSGKKQEILREGTHFSDYSTLSYIEVITKMVLLVIQETTDSSLSPAKALQRWHPFFHVRSH